MKLISVNLNEIEYELSVDNEKSNNIFTVIIGKNGCGKSRLLSKVANTFISVNKYKHNYTKVIKNKKNKKITHELTFSNNDKKIKVNSIKKRN